MSAARVCFSVFVVALVTWALCSLYLTKVHRDENEAFTKPLTRAQIYSIIPIMPFYLTRQNYGTFIFEVVPGSFVAGILAGFGTYRVSGRLMQRRSS